jgi:hypothetical protein
MCRCATSISICSAWWAWTDALQVPFFILTLASSRHPRLHYAGATSTTFCLRLLVKILGHWTNFPVYLCLAHNKTLWLVKYTNHCSKYSHIYYKNIQTKPICYRTSNTKNQRSRPRLFATRPRRPRCSCPSCNSSSINGASGSPAPTNGRSPAASTEQQQAAPPT